MNKFFLLFSCVFSLTACHTASKTIKESNDHLPGCIQKSITLFSKTECDKNPNVKEYTFQGKQVFVFDPGKCGADMTSEVFDKDCKSLGFLGGFIGNMKINGEDFSNAVYVKTSWEK